MSTQFSPTTKKRVNFACAVILSGRNTTRKFDSCFEDGDANQVGAGVYRRALKNPKIMDSLSRYCDVAMCKEDYAQYFGEAA